MTTIDGFPVSTELVEFLKSNCSNHEVDEPFVGILAHNLSGIQDYFCRHLDMIEEKDRKTINDFIVSLVDSKDVLTKLSELLPIIKYEA